jgi:hypothetical protein
MLRSSLQVQPPYARGAVETLPSKFRWDDVRAARSNMSVWEEGYPRVYRPHPTHPRPNDQSSR